MRRILIVLFSAITVAALVVACGQPEKAIGRETVVVEGTLGIVEKVEVPTETPEPTAATLEKESPMLAARVTSGELPSLEERLPDVPLVVTDGTLAFKGAIPDLALGRYGGTLKTQHLAGGLDAEAFYANVEPVVTGPDIVLEGAYANVFEGFEVSPDNTKFTFTLRKGLKWSDGTPVTVQDVAFVIKDLYFNEEYMDVPHAALLSPDDARTPAEFKILSEWTFRLTFAAPYGSFITTLALGGAFSAWPSYQNVMQPRHVLEKWHPRYADPAWLAEELDRAGLTADEWPTLLNQKMCTHWDLGVVSEKCMDYPSLSPYVLKKVTFEAATFERNPYYWKVDWEGRQLPYIDTWISVTTADLESGELLAMNGEIDDHWQIDPLKASMYMEREKTLGYDLELGLTLHADGHTFFFNGCTTDPVLRALFNDIRFRKAMNYAMDRQEVNENVCLGLAEMPTSIMESAYSPEKANALLDEIGMTERDADGYRLSPDGRPVRILVEYNTQAAPSQLPRSCDLFAEHMKAVGIHAEPRGSESAVYSEHAAAHEIQISAWYTSSPTDADALFTLTPGSLCWCPAWNWTKESGTPKPEDMPDEFVAYMRAIAERKQYVPRSPEDAALYDVIKAFYRDRYWALVSTTSVPRPIWINGKLGNTVRTGTSSGYFRAMEILYFKEP